MLFLKKILLFTSFFLVLFSVVIFLFYKKSSQSGEFPLPKQTEEIVQLNKKIEETTLPEAKLVDKDTYLVAEGKKEQEFSNPNYMIYYFQDTGEYRIVLLNTPLEKIRKEAEEAFLQQMSAANVTKKESCLLFVSVVTIASVDEINSGKNFGLSFCPNAKNFE